MRISDPAITHQRTDPALCAMLGLQYYYPMAEAIAENCLSIKEVA